MLRSAPRHPLPALLTVDKLEPRALTTPAQGLAGLVRLGRIVFQDESAAQSVGAIMGLDWDKTYPLL